MVSELMGHRNIQTTMRYLRVKNMDALQAVQTLVESPGPCLVKKDRRHSTQNMSDCTDEDTAQHLIETAYVCMC